MDLDVSISATFSSALEARNKLNHGFYERHNFKIQTDEGRDEMIADLESLHQPLFDAWQPANLIAQTLQKKLFEERSKAKGKYPS